MIRAARPEDAEAIAGVQLRAWVRAYADFLPPEAVEPEAAQARRVRWEAHLAEPPGPGAATLVWDQDGRLAGFASVGPARGADAAPGRGELAALYVDPVAHGAGVGSALLAAARAHLEAKGFREAVLWVFTANGQARELYEGRGWALEDVVHPDASTWWAPAVRYRLAL